MDLAEESGQAWFVRGGGEMGRRIRACDWAATPFGPLEGWSRVLKGVLSLVLSSDQPMFIGWGRERYWLYNDAFIPILGARHPRALGRKAAESWPEIRAQMDPLIERVFAGEFVRLDDLPLPLERDGGMEEAYFSFAYTPIRDEEGGVCAMFGVGRETTGTVLTIRSLAAEHARLAELFEHAPAFMVMLRGPDHRIEFANPEYMKLTGNRPILGRKLAEALPELVAQGYVRLFGQAYTSGEPVSVARRRYVQPAGAEVFLDLVVQPVRDIRGQVTGVCAVGVDVTANVLADTRRAALARLTERIAALDDPEEIGFIAGEILGLVLGCGRAGYAMVDLEYGALRVPRGWAVDGAGRFNGMFELLEHEEAFAQLKQGEMAVITCATGGGTPACVIAAPVLEEGRLVALLYAGSDSPRNWLPEESALVREFAARTRTAVERARVTLALRAAYETLERRVAETLAERKLFADLVETTDALIQVLGPDFRILAANKAMLDEYERVYGFRPRVGDNLLELLAGRPEERADVGAAWGRALAGEAYNCVGEFGDAALSRKWYDLRFRLLYAPDGAPIGAYQFATDVTDRLREQARLQAAEEQLRQSQKMEAVGQLTGGIAHDFNNLLAGIGGSLELLEKRLGEGRLDAAARYITAAQDAVRRASSLTQRLLAFSRRQTLDPRPTDVNRLVAGMEELIRRSVGPNIELRVTGEAGLWPTRIDASQLEGALLNLCVNGRDAMAPDGGHLTITASNATVSEAAAQGRDLSPGEYVVLCVADTGCGMAPDVMARVFDPFFTTKPLGAGTGLGLSMVHGFVRQSGGQVTIASSPGQGCMVSLYLPRHAGEVEPEVEALPHAPDAGAGEVVLVVDDEATIRLLLTEVLQENGYRVIEAADGAAAMQVLNSAQEIDLLVSDIGLPGGMNGRQVANAARALRPGLKILFITGFAAGAAVGDLEPGMEVMTKPFTLTALADKIHELMLS